MTEKGKENDSDMHYTGNIIRPPHEARNVLLQVTVGCSHNKCAFCSIYDTPFAVSPMAEIEEDLAEVRDAYPTCPRVFLLNGDAFALPYETLKAIALKIREYLPDCRIISMYASIGNVRNKTVEQLRDLRSLCIAKLTIGVESGDDTVLARINKGYAAKDIIEQCAKLDAAGIPYNFIYLLALAGHGGGEKNALESARIFNQANPTHIGATSLTLRPGSELYDDALAGRFREAREMERARELLTLIENLNIDVFFAANHISNAVVVKGRLPADRERMAATVRAYIEEFDEDAMRRRRRNLRTL